MEPNFRRCEQAATDILLNQDITDFPTKIRSLVLAEKVYIDSIQNYCKITGLPLEDFIQDNGLFHDGCTLAEEHFFLILYNREKHNRERLNWTLAHEIGHICLGHTLDNDIQEVEANFFAAQLLMPKAVVYTLIRSLDKVDATTIAALFGVSLSAARKRLDSIYTSSSGYRGVKNRKLIELYTPLIDKYIESRHQKESYSPHRLGQTEFNQKTVSDWEEKWLDPEFQL